MLTINLLPWREEKRERVKKQFKLQLIITLAVVIALTVGLHVWLAMQLSQQQARNQFLQQTTQRYDQKIQAIGKLQRLRKDITSRINIIYYLQARRAFAVFLFVDFVNITPDGVYFTKIERDDDNLEMTGKADSNAQVSQLMRNIGLSSWLQDAKLSVIKTDKQNKFQRNFELTVSEKIKQQATAKMEQP